MNIDYELTPRGDNGGGVRGVACGILSLIIGGAIILCIILATLGVFSPVQTQKMANSENRNVTTKLAASNRNINQVKVANYINTGERNPQVTSTPTKRCPECRCEIETSPGVPIIVAGFLTGIILIEITLGIIYLGIRITKMRKIKREQKEKMRQELIELRALITQGREPGRTMGMREDPNKIDPDKIRVPML